MGIRSRGLRGDIFAVPIHGRGKSRDGVDRPGIEQFHPGQQVRVAGLEDVFVVLRIDRERHLADLLRQTTVKKVEIGVPLALLKSAEESDAVGEMPVSA